MGARTIHQPSSTRLSLFALLLTAAVPATQAADFKYPLAVAAAKDGTIYLADRTLPGVWKVKDGKAEIFHRASKKFRTPLNAIRCLGFDKDGNLLAGDSATREVYRFDKDGKPQPIVKAADPKHVGIGIPMALAVDSKGNLLVADLETHRIWKLAGGTGKPEEFAVVPAPRGLAFDAKDRLWIVSHGKHHVLRLSSDGKKTETIVEGRAFQFAHNIVLGKDDTAYVSDGYSKAIWKIPPGGKPAKWIEGAPLANPVGLAMLGEQLLIIDPRAKALFEAGADGKLKTIVSK